MNNAENRERVYQRGSENSLKLRAVNSFKGSARFLALAGLAISPFVSQFIATADAEVSASGKGVAAAAATRTPTRTPTPNRELERLRNEGTMTAQQRLNAEERAKLDAAIAARTGVADSKTVVAAAYAERTRVAGTSTAVAISTNQARDMKTATAEARGRPIKDAQKQRELESLRNQGRMETSVTNAGTSLFDHFAWMLPVAVIGGVAFWIARETGFLGWVRRQFNPPQN